MEISDLVIRLIVLLLPGFLSVCMIVFLSSKRKFDNRDYIIYTIILSFLSYLCLSIFSCIFPKTIENVTFFNALLDAQIKINTTEVLISSIISIIIGIVISIIINKGLFYKLFRKIKVTNRTGANSVWDEFIDNNGNGFEDYIYVVDFENDIVYGGQVLNYSNDSNNQIEIVLKDVVVTTNTDRKTCLRRIKTTYLKLPKEKIYIEVSEVVHEQKNGKKRSKS